MGEHIIVVGGGVIGLSCAFELAGRGRQVTLLEANRCGGQASGAAAGMLAPYSENGEGPDDFFHLCKNSLELYPVWQQEIKEISGVSFEYAASGSLNVVYHEADLLALEERLAWQNRYGASAHLLQDRELRDKEPQLSREVIAAIYCPRESHIYAPGYVKALEAACRKRGVRIEDGLGMIGIEEWKDEVEVTSVSGHRFSGDRLVICSGAWSQSFEDVFGLSLPIYPIRGQICAYEDEASSVNHMVFSSQGYLVGKGNGTLVSGASEDIAGFDSSVTEKGIARLLKWNKRVFPFLEARQPFHTWAGLRPATQDGYPFIGKLSGAGQVVWAAGHYRNGILLSPVTARLVADLIDGTADERSLASFSPERFTA